MGNRRRRVECVKVRLAAMDHIAMSNPKGGEVMAQLGTKYIPRRHAIPKPSARPKIQSFPLDANLFPHPFGDTSNNETRYGLFP